MKLPRDMAGEELARLLRRYGYEITRQTGSHLRLTARVSEREHHITIPAHQRLKVGTLHSILADIATFLKMDRGELLKDLFGG